MQTGSTITGTLQFTQEPPAVAGYLMGLPEKLLAPDTAVQTHTVLLVDSEEINRRVLRGMLRVPNYRLIEAQDPLEALRILDKESVDLIIADLVLPEIGGLEFCRRVKASASSRLTPILIMSNLVGVENEVAGLDSGADEFLTKPVQPAALRTRVRAMLRSKRSLDSLEEAGSILFALARAVEARDKNTSDHCERLASLSVALGTAIGLNAEQLQALHQGGFLHDIGKISVPDAILFKNGKLTAEEWVIMRSHAVAGEQICRPMRSLAPVIPIIRHHHERWNGTGYPDGIFGKDIPLLARVLQLADIYDALTSVRPYKPALSPVEALSVLSEEVALGWRDPELVAVFRDLILQMGDQHSVALPPPPVAFTEQDATQEALRLSLGNMNRELLK
jgi:putative two-component system response regulator